MAMDGSRIEVLELQNGKDDQSSLESPHLLISLPVLPTLHAVTGGHDGPICITGPHVECRTMSSTQVELPVAQRLR